MRFESHYLCAPPLVLPAPTLGKCAFADLKTKNEYHPDPSMSALRQMIFTNTNSFNDCIVHRGRRLLIDEELCFQWLESQSKAF